MNVVFFSNIFSYRPDDITLYSIKAWQLLNLNTIIISSRDNPF